MAGAVGWRQWGRCRCRCRPRPLPSPPPYSTRGRLLGLAAGTGRNRALRSCVSREPGREGGDGARVEVRVEALAECVALPQRVGPNRWCGLSADISTAVTAWLRRRSHPQQAVMLYRVSGIPRPHTHTCYVAPATPVDSVRPARCRVPGGRPPGTHDVQTAAPRACLACTPHSTPQATTRARAGIAALQFRGQTTPTAEEQILSRHASASG